MGPPAFAPNCSRWKSVRGLPSEVFEPLEVEERAVELVRAALGDDVDDAAGRAAELGAGSGGDDLKLFDGVERDVYGRALAAGLLAEEAVHVVAAVETDVVEDAALAREVDLVAVRPLHDGDVRRQRQQVFKLAPEDGEIADGLLVDGRTRFRLDGVHDRDAVNRHLRHLPTDFHIQVERDGLSDRQRKALQDEL